MNTMLITTALFVVLGLGGVLFGRTLLGTHRGGLGFTLCFTGTCLLFLAAGIPTITYGSRALNRTECSNWSRQTNRPARFVVYTSWSGGDCLTRTSGGKWISKDMLREFGNQP